MTMNVQHGSRNQPEDHLTSLQMSEVLPESKRLLQKSQRLVDEGGLRSCGASLLNQCCVRTSPSQTGKQKVQVWG